MKRIDIVTVKMVKEKSVKYHLRKIASPQDAVALVQPFLEGNDREEVIALFLNTKNEPVALHSVSVGTLNSSLIHPREVLKGAILSNAAGFILFHNHPSGDTSPSAEDQTSTQRMAEAGKLIGIEFLDHLILAEDSYLSMKEHQPELFV